AHLINQGLMPHIQNDDAAGDFFFVDQEDPDTVADTIVDLVTRRIPAKFGLDPFDDIQVLTPMHKGSVGAISLNNRLQKALNPSGNGIARGEATFGLSDKVMQIRNNYDKEVFNGDIGRIVRIDQEARMLMVLFDGREVAYDFSELDELVLAYAISVHKSQGSEYPAVVMPILTQHYVLLQRNLVYTAVTRGRRLVVMVGTKKALAIGVNNNRPNLRYTRLRQRLAG
ncbi:MAG: ATP-dependent DNA helicase, partial [Thermodesulfobacteriota bacterium]